MRRSWPRPQNGPVKTTFLRTATADSLLLQGQLYEPEQNYRAAVLHLHGMGGNFYENRFLDAMAAAYASAGLALLTVNTRGHDMISDIPLVGQPAPSVRRGVAYEVFAECVKDVAAWLDVLADRLPVPLFLQGHSLGASKAVHYLSTSGDPRVAGVILLSPTEMLQYAEAQPDHLPRLAEAQQLAAEGSGDTLLPGLVWRDGYVLSAGTYVDFTTRGNPIDVFSGYAPEQPAPLGRLRQPMLSVMGRSDEGILAIATSAEAYLALLRRKATGCSDFTAYVPDCNHGYRDAEEEVAAAVAGWIADRA